MIRLSKILIGIALLAAQLAPAVADNQTKVLVLATDSHTGISPLPITRVRALFMGVPVVVDDIRLRPVLNETDMTLREVFLQKVLFVSWSHYQRRLLEDSFRSGWPVPVTATDAYALQRALHEQAGADTYMWKDDAGRMGFKVVQVLWSGPVN